MYSARSANTSNGSKSAREMSPSARARAHDVKLRAREARRGAIFAAVLKLLPKRGDPGRRFGVTELDKSGGEAAVFEELFDQFDVGV